MATTNLTGTKVNGVFEISAANSPTSAAGATSEQILFRDSGDVQASGSATVTFNSCNIYLDDVSGTSGNPNSCPLSYNGDSTDRGDNGRYIRFFDTQIIYLTSARRNIFVSELTRSNVIDQDSGSNLFIYTQPNAILDTVLLQGINTIEVVGQFGVAFNITIDDVTKAYLNWEAGRLDFFGLGITNKPTDDAQADAWLGNGATNNTVWHWNNQTTFDNQRLYMTTTTNRYYDGVTISWEFIDRDTTLQLEDVKVKVKDDFPGATNGGVMTERGEYLTNSSGHITGTWDGQNRTIVTNGDRNTFFMVRNAVEQVVASGSNGTKSYPVSVITGDQGDRVGNYDIDIVLNQVEVKAYNYEARSGFINGDYFDITTQIGLLASDVSVDSYSTFVLTLDVGVSETNITTVESYTQLEDLDKAYDRIKAEWYNNNDYPLCYLDVSSMNIGSTDLIIDGSAGTAYSYAGGVITISTNTGDLNLDVGTNINGITTTGVVTVQNSATINSLIINGDVLLSSVVDLTDVIIYGDLEIDTAGTYTFSNTLITGDITSSDSSGNVIINSVNGSSLSSSEQGDGNGQVNVIQTVPIKVIVKDIISLELLENAQVLIEADSGGDLPYRDAVSITRSGTIATVSHTAHGFVTDEYAVIRGANELDYRGQHQITVLDNNTYTYVVSNSPTTPATGTITSTALIINETTDSSGEVNKVQRFTNDQPLIGRVRKATP